MNVMEPSVYRSRETFVLFCKYIDLITISNNLFQFVLQIYPLVLVVKSVTKFHSHTVTTCRLRALSGHNKCVCGQQVVLLCKFRLM